MGIQNLLPFLENSSRECNIREFRGSTVAVDSYCWLHKGAIGCALQLAKSEKTDVYIQYCLKYVNLLLSNNIKPIMVFDGRRLPAKKKTEEKRRGIRKHAKHQVIEMLRLGQMDEAYRFAKQSVDITPQMALNLIKECRKLNVDCIVAPYESDAQLAFFVQKNIAECVISEDSDLLLFGCTKVLYKMDLTGMGKLVDAAKINLSMKMRETHFSMEKFRHMCILSGCDYLDNLPGIGIKKALKFLTLTAENDPKLFLDKLPSYLNKRQLEITEEYKSDFMRADATFLYQIVFNPFTRKLERLNPLSTDEKYCCNAGEFFDSNEALQLALGNKDPNTMSNLDNWNPSNALVNQHSIWSESYKCRPPPKQLPAKQPPLKQIRPKQIQKPDLGEDNIDEMLQFYKKASIEKDLCKSQLGQDSSEEDDLDINLQLSPVLNKNPFVRKGLSKFAPTDLDSRCVVRSRFFSGNGKSVKCDTEENPPNLNTIQDSMEHVKLSQTSQNSLEISSQQIISETHDENMDISSFPEEKTPTFTQNVLKATQDSQESDIYDGLDHLPCSENSNSENISDNNGTSHIEQESFDELEEKTMKSQNKTFGSSDKIIQPSKKRKVQVRSKPLSQMTNQPSIKDMFKKMNSI